MLRWSTAAEVTRGQWSVWAWRRAGECSAPGAGTTPSRSGAETWSVVSITNQRQTLVFLDRSEGNNRTYFQVGEAGDTENDGESAAKRSKGGGVTRTPMQTLGGHKEAVSGLVWTEADTLASASMDHTIKLWDVELGGLKHELVGNKAFFSLSHNPLTGSLLASSGKYCPLIGRC